MKTAAPLSVARPEGPLSQPLSVARHFVRAHDAAERIAQLTADPDPENPNWKLYLATAMSQLDLALHQATWPALQNLRVSSAAEHNAFPKGRWS